MQQLKRIQWHVWISIDSNNCIGVFVREMVRRKRESEHRRQSTHGCIAFENSSKSNLHRQTCDQQQQQQKAGIIWQIHANQHIM